MSIVTSILEIYLEKVERHLLGYPKADCNQFLSELADILLQQYSDYCNEHNLSEEKNTSADQFYKTLDAPVEVAKDFSKGLAVQRAFWGSSLQHWKTFEDFITNFPVLSAWIIGLTLGVLPMILWSVFPWIVEWFTVRMIDDLGDGMMQMTVVNYAGLFFGILTFILFIVIIWRFSRRDCNPVKLLVFTILSLVAVPFPFFFVNLFNYYSDYQEMAHIRSYVFQNSPTYLHADYLDPLGFLLNQLGILFFSILFGVVLGMTIYGFQRIFRTTTLDWKKIIGVILLIVMFSAFVSLPITQVRAIELSPDPQIVYFVNSTKIGYDPFEIKESDATDCWILGNLTVLWSEEIAVNFTNSPRVDFNHYLNNDRYYYDDKSTYLTNGSYLWIWPFNDVNSWKSYAESIDGKNEDGITIQAKVRESTGEYIENRTTSNGRFDLVVDLESRLPTFIYAEGDFTKTDDRDSWTIKRCYVFAFPIEVDLFSQFVVDTLILCLIAVTASVIGQGILWTDSRLKKMNSESED